MSRTTKSTLLLSLGAMLLSAGPLHAQSVADQLPSGTTLSSQPAGTVPVASPTDSASNPATQGAQIVKNVSGTANASTPGVLGENGLPSITSASSGNVAGLLSYCIQKKLVNSTTARATARSLARRPDVKTDQGYSLGGQGLLQTGTTTPFDVATLEKSKRVEICSDLIKKGQSLNN